MTTEQYENLIKAFENAGIDVDISWNLPVIRIVSINGQKINPKVEAQDMPGVILGFWEEK